MGFKHRYNYERQLFNSAANHFVVVSGKIIVSVEEDNKIIVSVIE